MGTFIMILLLILIIVGVGIVFYNIYTYDDNFPWISAILIFIDL